MPCVFLLPCDLQEIIKFTLVLIQIHCSIHRHYLFKTSIFNFQFKSYYLRIKNLYIITESIFFTLRLKISTLPPSYFNGQFLIHSTPCYRLPVDFIPFLLVQSMEPIQCPAYCQFNSNPTFPSSTLVQASV